MKNAIGIGGDGEAEVINEGEIQGVFTGSGEGDELDGGGVIEEPANNFNTEFCLLRAKKEDELCGGTAEEGQVNHTHVFIVDENMVDGQEGAHEGG